MTDTEMRVRAMEWAVSLCTPDNAAGAVQLAQEFYHFMRGVLTVVGTGGGGGGAGRTTIGGGGGGGHLS
jgi:hypothetical protein